MWRSMVVLLFIALVAESHSKIHPLSVHKTITENLNVKRQIPEQNGCVEAKVNQTLPGSECEARVNDIETMQSKKSKMTKISSTSLSRFFANPSVEISFWRHIRSAEFWTMYQVLGSCLSGFVQITKEPHVIRTFTQPSMLPPIQHFDTSITSKRKRASVKTS